MDYYPVFLDLRGKSALVVGGGAVATEKAPRLISAGAKLRVVAPMLTPELQGLVDQGHMAWLQRGFEEGDTRGAPQGDRGTRQTPVQAGSGLFPGTGRP